MQGSSKVVYARIVLLTILAMGLTLGRPLSAGWFGPSNYDECILDSMKGVVGDVAARLIRQSCAQKFPAKAKPSVPSRDLSQDKIAQITGRAALSYGDAYAGNLYNGNASVTLTQVTIAISSVISGMYVTKNYSIDVTIPPLTARDFSISIVVGDYRAEYGWSIISAKGY